MWLSALLRQDNAARREMVLKQPVLRTIMFLSAPGFMMLLIAVFTPIVDALLIYNFAGEAAGAAITHAASFFNIFIMGATGISVAGSAIIGQTLGSGDMEKSRSYSVMLVVTAVCIGAALTPVMIATGYFVALGVEEALRGPVFIVTVFNGFTLPFVLFQNCYAGIRNIEGKPEKNFLRQLLFLPLKILFSLLFIVFLRLGVLGAGLSTLCSYVFLAVYMYYDMFIKRSPDRLSLSLYRFDRGFLRRVLVIGVPAMLQYSTKNIGFFLVRVEVAGYGELAMNAQSLAENISNIFFSFSMFCDSAVTTMVSVNVGAGQGERAKRSAMTAIGICAGFSVALTALCYFVGPLLLPLYTGDPALITLAARTLRIYSTSIILFSVMFIESAALTGLGATVLTLIIQSVRIWVIRFAVMYALYAIIPGIGVIAVFWSFSACNILGGVISHVIFTRVKWQKQTI